MYKTASGNGKYLGYGSRIENRNIEDHHHHRYLQHNPESTRHRYSPQSRQRSVEDYTSKKMASKWVWSPRVRCQGYGSHILLVDGKKKKRSTRLDRKNRKNGVAACVDLFE